MIEAAMNMVEGDLIEAEHLPLHLLDRMSGTALFPAEKSSRGMGLVPKTGQLSLPEVLRDVEEQMIEQAMRETEGNILRAAKLLGIPRQTLQYKLSQRSGANR